MKPITAIFACALLVGGVEVYLGQNAPRVFGTGVLQEHMSIYDADNDGGIDTEELQALQADQKDRRTRLRDRWDLNGDGRISNLERERAKEQMRKLIEQRRLMRFRAEDIDDDHKLSEREFKAIKAVAATVSPTSTLATDLFRHLDENKDGFITEREFLRGLDRTRTEPGDVIDPDPAPKRHPKIDSRGP